PVECGADSGPSAPCVGASSNLASLTFINNHLITSNSTPLPTGGVPTTQNNQVVQTLSAANSQGYSLSNYFTPTSAVDLTVGAGRNLSASCSGPLASLCSDRLKTARPANGAWNAGAYQFAGGTLPPVINSAPSATGTLGTA